MKIHSVFNYKLDGLKVKCVTSIVAVFYPLLVNEIISAIFLIYQRNYNYIGDFLDISTYRQKPTVLEEAIPKLHWDSPTSYMQIKRNHK